MTTLVVQLRDGQDDARPRHVVGVAVGRALRAAATSAAVAAGLATVPVTVSHLYARGLLSTLGAP